jgi:tetratricopeptide (TPR) repeat protein
LRPIDLGGTARTAPEFRPDGKLMARESGQGAVRLLGAAGGRELARLEAPDQGRCAFTTFSPDGRYLVATNGDFPALHVWDLCELRRQLKEFDLDWDAPPDPAAKTRADGVPLPRLEVEVDAGNLKALTRQREAAIQRNDEAWRLVTGPADKRDPPRALELMRQALRDDPDDPTLLNTLGVVQYRNGQHREAVATLERSLAAGKGQFDAFDLFFLAMAHVRLGNPAKARECFDQAVKWCGARKDLSPEHVEDLKAFRAEAEQVLLGP